MNAIDYLVWLGDPAADAALISHAQRQLSQLRTFGLPVLPGFILTGDFYQTVLDSAGIDRLLADELPHLDWQNGRSVAAFSKALTTKIKKASLPADLKNAAMAAYAQLVSIGKARHFLLTAACSGTPDAPITLHPPLPVSSLADFLRAIPLFYATLFELHNLNPALIDDLQRHRLQLSLIVQPLHAVTASGSLTLQPLTIEAVFGRLEPWREGLIAADRYTVDPETVTIVSRDINRQLWQLNDLHSPTKHRTVSSLDQTAQKIEDETVLELAKWAIVMQNQTDWHLTLDWQLDNRDQLWLTAVRSTAAAIAYDRPVEILPMLLTGRALVPGRAVGVVRLLHQRADLANLEAHDIAVVENLSLFGAALPEIEGIVTESGRATDGLAKMATEQGLPIILAPGATRQLQAGVLVTLDGRTGQIYAGRVANRPNWAEVPKIEPITGTKLLSRWDSVPDATCADDGIGRLSAHTLLKEINLHPKSAARDGQRKILLAHFIDTFCQVAGLYQPRPVIYASNDLLTTDYGALSGGAEHEKGEANPLLGYHGLHRSLCEPDFFQLELEAIRRVRDDYGYTNVHLMLPFVRTLSEMTAARHMILGSGLRPGVQFKLWLECQTPSSLLLIEPLASHGLVQGISLDVDHLSQLLLGADAANVEFEAEFDFREPTVLEAMGRAINEAHRHGLPVLATGATLDRFPDGLESLLRFGLTGLIVEPDLVAPLRQLVASIEQRLLLDHVVAELRAAV